MLIVALLTFTAVMLAAGALFFWATPTVAEAPAITYTHLSRQGVDRNSRQAGRPICTPVVTHQRQ
jgi:hypothetical protein